MCLAATVDHDTLRGGDAPAALLDLDALTASLPTRRAGVARPEAAAAEIRRADLTLDLSRLAPGTVVVVPEVDGLRRDLSDAAAADHPAEQLRAGVAALEGPDVDRLRGVAGLAEAVDSLRARLEEEDEESRRNQELLKTSGAAWTQQLEELRRLM